MIDLPPLWVPPKPAIIRAASMEDVKRLAPASGQFPAPFFAGRTKALEYRTTTFTESTLTTFTFSSQDIGAAAADRRVHVAAFGIDDGGAARTLSSLTVGGVTATINGQLTNARATAALCTVAFPTGTTATVVATYSGNMLGTGIAIWRSTGLFVATAHHVQTSTANPGSVTLNTLLGGFAIGVMQSNSNITYTWTGLTEDFDVFGAENRARTGAHVKTTTGSLAITCTQSTGNTARAFIAGSW